MRPPVAMLRRNAETARAIEEILELPDGMLWSNVKLVAESDQIIHLELDIMPSLEQVQAIMELAYKRPISVGTDR